MMTDNLLVQGTRLGDYEVRELLGTGGMASVYKGYDAALDRDVAIKVIRTDDQSPDFVSRFQREARVVASLRHPNIVQVFQFGEQDDFVYMVQEFLPGETLHHVIRRFGKRRMGTSRVHDIVGQLANALDFAHSQGITHRDVKPSNAIYNIHDELVLTDFGIARREADASVTVTGAGVVMGTPGYIAPEQAMSSTNITPACDIYALGVVIFELLTGRLPFDADTAMDVVMKHIREEPPSPSSFRSDLPKSVDRVVLKALSKEPQDRYMSAGSLAKALQNAFPVGKSGASRSSKSSSGQTPKKSAGSSQNGKRSSNQDAGAAQAKGSAHERDTGKEQTTSSGQSQTSAKAEKQAGKEGMTSSSSRTTAQSQAATQQDTTPEPASDSHPKKRKLGGLLIMMMLVVLIATLAVLEYQFHTVTDLWQQVQVMIP